MVSLFFSASFLLIVVISLFFGDTIASEASWSSLRYLLAMPVPRIRLLRQKVLVAGLLSVLALVHPADHRADHRRHRLRLEPAVDARSVSQFDMRRGRCSGCG